MITDWLKVMTEEPLGSRVLDYLRQMPFDELVELDLINNRCRNLYHIEEKFYVPFLEGAQDAVYRFAVENTVHPEDRDIQRGFMNPDDMFARLRESPIPGVLETEVRFRLLNGGWCWTREVLVGGPGVGLPEGVCQLFIFDIERVKQRELGDDFHTPDKTAAIHMDELTGLPTDRDFFLMAHDRMGHLERGEWCVIAIDIEHFKLYTDWHGKMAGEVLLTEISRALKRVAQESLGLAGYHGLDNFWLMIPYDQELIRELYDEIRTLIVRRSNTVGFLPIFGICVIHDPHEEISDILNHAAMTAEQVKGDLHNRIRIYDAAAYNKTVEEYRMLSDFQHGLENHEVFFCLQPQCRVSNGSVVGAESLARWRRSDGRMVPPGVFVPVLEKYGMVTNLDQYIWEEVCKWLHDWTAAGHTAVPISINLSQTDILTIDVPRRFRTLLEKYDLPHNLIKVEITESAYVSDTTVVRETVRRLREMGLLVLMDDFGSGYSSLNMLRSLNVDVIKLDAQFLHMQTQEERKGISILESVINMTKTMHLPIIVEGVETQEQINFLSDLGCRYMQGYYFHRPMTVAEFEKMLLDERNIDLHGFEFKGNEQMHPREFLDENVFSDAMLNNILGAVAIYRWQGATVDIERYNQQFYHMVSIPMRQLATRLSSIEKYIFPDDLEDLYALLGEAAKDHLNGARGTLRFYRPNNSVRWISLHVYFLSQDENGMHFYGKTEDVTEIQYINSAIPGGYIRVSTDGQYRFEYLSPNFLEMVGYTAGEMKSLFGNRMTNLVYEDDRELLTRRMFELSPSHSNASQPYRLKHKTRSFIYVVMQTLVVDLSGSPCYMSIATDVTDVMMMRNQMRILSSYLSDSIVFLGQKDGVWVHHVVVHGLEEKLGMDARTFEDALNSYQFYYWVKTEDSSTYTIPIFNHLRNNQPFETELTVKLPDGRSLPLLLKMDTVDDDRSNIRYICVIRAV